jgi:hypothetical protein
MPRDVTDPEILRQLNADVTDPEILRQLNAPTPAPAQASAPAPDTVPTAGTPAFGSTAGGAAFPQPERRRAVKPKPYYPEGVTAGEYMQNMGNAAGRMPVAAYHGVKQLLGGDVSKEEIEKDRAIADKPGGFLGGVTGSLSTGNPIWSGGKWIIDRGLSVLPQALRTAGQVATPATLAGTQAAVTQAVMPDTEESRLKNARNAAIFTLPFQAAGGAAKLVAQPVRPSEETSRFLAGNVDEAGKVVGNYPVVPTVGRGGEGVRGGVASVLQSTLAKMPFGIGKQTQRGIERAERELVEARGDHIAIYPTHDLKPGTPEWHKEVRKQHSEAYDQVFRNKTYDPVPIELSAARTKGANAASFTGLGPKAQEARATFEAQLNSRWPQGRQYSGEEWHERLKLMKQDRDAYAGKDDIRDKKMLDAWNVAIEEFEKSGARKMLSPRDVANLTDLDKRTILRKQAEAATLATKGDDKKLFSETLKAHYKLTPDEQQLMGTGFGRQQIMDAQKVIGGPEYSDALTRRIQFLTANKAVDYGLGAGLLAGGSATIGLPATVGIGGTLYGLGKGSSAALTSRGGARAMFGDYPIQKKTMELLRRQAGKVSSTAGRHLGSEKDIYEDEEKK